MADDPQTLPIRFFSIVIKRAAVARGYPGGLEAFDRTHQPANGNEQLSLLSRMGLGDVDTILSDLFHQDLIPGQDIAAAEMSVGPLLECPGLTFESAGDFPARWTVKADAGQEGAPGSWDSEKRTAFTPENPLGYWWDAPAPPAPSDHAPRIKPPAGLTANQYYQWRGLHGTEEGDE